MATGIFNNGDYTIEDDSNGDLVVTDPNDNTVLKWDTSIPGWTFNNNSITDVSDLDVGTVSASSADITTSGNLTYAPVFETTTAFSGGETKQFAIQDLLFSDMPVIAVAIPSDDPGNDHGYTVDKTWFDYSAQKIHVQVSETENAGGGQANLYAWQLNP